MEHVIKNLAAQIDPGRVGVPKVGADETIEGVLTTVYFTAAIVAVIVIIICGIIYTISQGDAQKIKRAKDGVMYSVIGLVIIMFAFVVTNFIVGRFS